MTTQRHSNVVLLSVLLGIAAGAPVALAAPPIEWTIYRPSNTGILGTKARSLHVDDAGLLWIGASMEVPLRGTLGGISAFDGQQWQTVSRDDYPIINDPVIRDIVDDANGFRWMASEGGLLRYDLAAGPGSLVRFDPSNSPMPTEWVSDIALAPDGTIWLAMFRVTNPNRSGGLAQYDPATNTWQVWQASELPWIQQFPGNGWVTDVAVTPDPGGGYTVWIGEFFDGGVATLRNGQFHWFGAPASIPPGAPTTPTAIPGKTPVDEQGNIWLNTNQGAARRAPDGSWLVIGEPPGTVNDIGTITPLPSGRVAVSVLSQGVHLWLPGWLSLGSPGIGVSALAEDLTGAIWAGGNGGVSKYENGQWLRDHHFTTGMMDYFIEAIAFDAAGNVYIEGNMSPGVGGFNIFDGTWTCVHDANLGRGPAWGQPSDHVDAFAVRANGNLVMSTSIDLLEWDGVNYTPLLGSGWFIEEIEEDALGRIWAAPGLPINGLNRITGPNQFDRYDTNNSPVAANVLEIRKDPLEAGFIWLVNVFSLIRTNGDVWNVYPLEFLGINNPLTTTAFSCLSPADDGTVWLGLRGADGGLIHFDPATGAVTKYDSSNAPFPDDNVHFVEAAPDGSVWVSAFSITNSLNFGGLLHFDGQNWTVYTWQNSPLRHNQLLSMELRPTPAGYELWAGTGSEGIAVISVTIPPPGDINGDGVVDLNDLPVFVAVLLGNDTDLNHIAASDMNNDGAADGLDTQPFVAALIP